MKRQLRGIYFTPFQSDRIFASAPSGAGLDSFSSSSIPFYIIWEVLGMKFDFKDLMAFGMFILALLTFINLIGR